MHAAKVCHKILDNALCWMHKLRREALLACVLAAISGQRLSVTGLGRAIRSDAKEKHCIKRADRLLSNIWLQKEQDHIYQILSHIIIGKTQRPIILIDWSDLYGQKQHYLLRATVALTGRPLTIYEEVHTLATKDKPMTHRLFLKHLKAKLPESCCPIIVTDAGFRTAWFKMVAKMNWDWVGRVRNRHLVKTEGNNQWFDCKDYYASATTIPKYLGKVLLTKLQAVTCHLVVVKAKSKGRRKLTKSGHNDMSKRSKKNSCREREPWLLATSLPVTSKLAKRVANIYGARMQIEEAFRDTKSLQFGLGFNLNRTYATKRIQMLLLIAMLATFILWLLGSITKLTGQFRYYQANTVKSRSVLSLLFLGLRVANDPRFNMQDSDVMCATNMLWDMEMQYGFEA